MVDGTCRGGSMVDGTCRGGSMVDWGLVHLIINTITDTCGG